MLLKDCPVGSVVRLVSVGGSHEIPHCWKGLVAIVQEDEEGHFVIDRDKDKRHCKNNFHHFEIIHSAPIAVPEPRITFTVGGQVFYVGQRVWSLVNASGGQYEVNPGDEMEVSALSAIGGQIVCRHVKTNVGAFCWPSDISTTPPAPHEWKRGDWARHDRWGVGFVSKGIDSYGSVSVDFCGITGPHDPSELTFISHSEPPK